MNFQNPTPIQEQAIPLALQGRDIIGCAQTGTGKTGAFIIPIVAHLAASPDSTALIMTPTRELALQIFEVARNMCWFENRWGAALIIGGTSYGPQFQQLRAKPRLVIGTPGRLQDHLDQRTLRLDKTAFLVLDEADRMLDMGFAPQIESILKSVPTERQTFLFTATLPREIEKMCHKFMKNPERITVGENSRPIEKIKQEVVETVEARKLDALFVEIEKREGSMLIFAKTKRRTERLSQELENSGFDVTSIHGDRSQRQRSDAIRDFRNGSARILVATDVAARGLDVPHIAHVINFDLPQVPEDFVHRIGRTARAGAEGSALTFVTPSERGMWRRIQHLISPMPARRERPSRSIPPVSSSDKSVIAAVTDSSRPAFQPRREDASERPQRSFRPRRDEGSNDSRPQRFPKPRFGERNSENSGRPQRSFSPRRDEATSGSGEGRPQRSFQRRDDSAAPRGGNGFRPFNGGNSQEGSEQRRFGGRPAGGGGSRPSGDSRPARPAADGGGQRFRGGPRKGGPSSKFSSLGKNEDNY